MWLGTHTFEPGNAERHVRDNDQDRRRWHFNPLFSLAVGRRVCWDGGLGLFH